MFLIQEALLKNTRHEFCFKNSPDLRRSLIALFYSIFLKETAFITDDTSCILTFVNELTEALKSHKMHSQAKPRLHHIIYNPEQLIDKEHDFYSLKTHGVRFSIYL